ncbi:hypothetical protein NHX12_031866 [Muraenolepis orangiensis]|uniref:DUF4795 domain-containing protein n=1 Tax=Muraenolepis orangiensis TaxID=630683 RepID=A0A9Q0E4Q6_9TELE|nr:hypothetical protein NHX12_031866 [Muraenolepis orangiensis]
MSGDIRLHNLVDLSIGTLDTGKVNFTALRTLLHAMLDHLDLRAVSVQWTGGGEEQQEEEEEDRTAQKAAPRPREEGEDEEEEEKKSNRGYRHLEERLRRIETQIAAAESLLPSAAELLHRSSASSGAATPVHDMWQLMQLRRQIQANGDGVSKSLSLVQDLLQEIQELKESRDRLKEKVEELHTALEKAQVSEALLQDSTVAVEKCSQRVDQLEAAARSLRERVELCPGPEALEDLVTWEVMQSALLSEREKLHKELSSGAEGPASDPPVRPSSPPSPPPPSPPRAEDSATPPARVGSAKERYPETLEALRVVGRLSDRHDDLEERVEKLEAELGTLEAELGRLDDLAQLEQEGEQEMKHLRSQVEVLSSDREKGECERLRDTTQHLLDNHQEKHTHIQQLYKSMEALEERKADRQLLEAEVQIKADKCALESKVSRVQLDSATEQLTSMFHDLLAKVTGQEQDWNQVIERLSSEMESKLNRMELDSLKKQLEDRWQNIRRKLQSQPAPEQEDAAGIRKQLVARFHCISCSRPVDMNIPGPHVVTVPAAPGLPSHRSSRPFTVYELDQVRQHCRSERIPEMTDYNYVTLSRRCGGSHTVTQPSRRSARFQHLTHLYQTEAPPAALLKLQPGEVDILGLDGQIYKGRLDAKTSRATDPRLPTLPPRDSTSKISDGRVQRFQSQRSGSAPGPGSGGPMRPQSTRTVRSRSGSGRAWPASVPATGSQGSLVDDLRSLADSSAELQRYVAPVTELHVDLRPPEDGPGTNL